MTPDGNARRSRRSAGLLPYRVGADGVEVFVGHMGGPLWARKDERAWTLVKGEYDDEEPLSAARREWAEETGLPVPDGDLVDLGEVRQSGGKVVRAWAVRAPGLDPAAAVSGTFELPWPPRSGRVQAFPELDRFAWLDEASARVRLVSGQVPLLDRLPGTAQGAPPVVPG